MGVGEDESSIERLVFLTSGNLDIMYTLGYLNLGPNSTKKKYTNFFLRDNFDSTKKAQSRIWSKQINCTNQLLPFPKLSINE